MTFQRPKNDPFSLFYNLGWRNHPNFSWNNGPNVMVPNSQPISHPFSSFQRLIFSGIPNAPRPPPLVAQVRPPPGYSNIDKMKRRINNNVERMINANMERIMRMMTEQFSQLASSSREPGTFPSQPEVNPKGHASSSSGNPSKPVRKVNAVISLHSDREINNQVRNPNEPCRYPRQIFQNSSSSSPPSSPETSSSSKPDDGTDGVFNDSDTSPSLESPSEKDEFKKKDSFESVDPSCSKSLSSSSSRFSSDKVHIHLPPFPHRLKKKDQAHVEKMRETFSQVKINIPLLDAIQEMPPSARFLKDLCTTKRATNVPRKTFLASSASSILSHQIPVKYKDPGCPTISIVIRDHLIHRALLDLGARVNLIPFTEYERLGLGDLKPTKMVI